MAQAKLGNPIVSIRGRYGGVYFKTGRLGQHIQAMPRHVNYTRAGKQLALTEGFSSMSAFWLLACLVYFGAAWAAFALLYLFTDKRGEKKRISGYNWYIHYALTFPETDEPHFWAPPPSPYALPDYVISSGTTWHLEHAPPDWPADAPYGYFYVETDWNGKPWYANYVFTWFLWWKDPYWVVSTDLGWEVPGLSFHSPGPEIQDYYRNPVTKKYCHVYAGKRELE